MSSAFDLFNQVDSASAHSLAKSDAIIRIPSRKPFITRVKPYGDSIARLRSVMVKPILLLSLLALPAASSERVAKPPIVEELQTMKFSVKNLEDLVAEHEERLRIHKAENNALRQQVSTLEARIAALEKER